MRFCESTYGDREHPEGDPLTAGGYCEPRGEAWRLDCDSRVCDRADATFMYYLRQLEDERRIPRIPVYVDSPMALSATDFYVRHKEDHDWT